MCGAHLGEFWNEIKLNYPKVEEKPPIIPVPGHEFNNWAMFPRCWFVNEDNLALIQIQKDRFIHNWRRKDESVDYPSFRNVFAEFKCQFEAYPKFLASRNLGKIEPTQFELTYINHIPAADNVWTSLNDLSNVFPAFSGQPTHGLLLGKVTGLSYVTNYDLPDNKGYLATKVESAIHNPTQTEVLRLSMMAKSSDANIDIEDLQDWFALAHKWIVKGFEDITATDIQEKVWKKEKKHGA